MTTTCDTEPVTDSAPDPTLDRLRSFAARIAKAKQDVKDLERERDEEIVAVVETWPRSVSAAARAAKLSRQRVDGIWRLARARRNTQS